MSWPLSVPLTNTSPLRQPYAGVEVSQSEEFPLLFQFVAGVSLLSGYWTLLPPDVL